jgi:hypothetical protein
MRERKPFILLLILYFIFFGGTASHAQKLLLIEKAGNPRAERIQLYDELKFTLKGDDKLWYKRQILDMDVNAQLLLLGETWTAINDIGRIRLKRQRAWANLVGGALQGGGASMILGDLYYTVVRNAPRYTDGGIEFGLVNIGVGTGVRSLFAPIKYKLGGRKRLRAVDLTF